MSPISLGVFGSAREGPDNPDILWTPAGIADGATSFPGFTFNLPTWTKETHEGVPYIHHVQGGNLNEATYALQNTSWVYSDVETITDINGPPITTTNRIGGAVRMQTAHSGYYAYANTPTTLFLTRQVPGSTANVRSLLASATIPTVSPTVPHRIRLQAIGPVIRARIWPAADVEPTGWHVEVTDTSESSMSSGYVGVAGVGRGSSSFRTFTAISIWDRT